MLPERCLFGIGQRWLLDQGGLGQALPPSAAVEGALIQHPGEQCLTCKDAAPCSVIYTFSSEKPFTGADMVYYPRWQADTRFLNKVRVSWSTDTIRWRELDTARGWGSKGWEGWQIPRSLAIRPATPAKEIFIRFGLSGDGAQLWSSPEHPMRILLRTGPGHEASSRVFPEPRKMVTATDTNCSRDALQRHRDC